MRMKRKNWNRKKENNEAVQMTVLGYNELFMQLILRYY